jgi:hypothetical protein
MFWSIISGPPGSVFGDIKIPVRVLQISSISVLVNFIISYTEALKFRHSMASLSDILKMRFAKVLAVSAIVGRQMKIDSSC